MTQILSIAPASRSRWRSVVATFALVGALFAATSTMPASADVVGTGPGPGTISGTATTPGGQAIAGAYVGVAFAGSTTTDANGHYELSGLELQEHQIYAGADGYQTGPGYQATLTAESPTAIVDIVLVPFPVGDGTLSGYVTGDGVPLANHSVTAYSNVTGQNVFGATDENGYYQFNDLGYTEWTVNSWGGPQYQYFNAPIVQLTADTPAATIDIAFLSWPVGTASIHGVLTDSVTGEPIPNANVSLNGIDVAHNSNATSDTSGAFSFDLLPEGNYFVSFSATGYLYANAQPIHALSDQPVTLDHMLIAANSTISGHVEDPDGAPVAGVGVSAATPDGNGGWAETDENGDYVITGIGAVTYTVNLGGVGTPYALQERVLAAVANADNTLDFTLANRTTGYISGIVLGPDGNYYDQTVCATLYSAKNKKPLAKVATFTAESGDGSFNFDNVKPGTYTVEFRDCDDDPTTKFDKVFLGGVKNFKDATFVTIAAAQDSFENVVTLTPRSN